MKTSDNYKKSAPCCWNCKHGMLFDERWFCMLERTWCTKPISKEVQDSWSTLGEHFGITRRVRLEAYEKVSIYVGTGGGICDKYEPLTEESVAHENS